MLTTYSLLQSGGEDDYYKGAGQAGAGWSAADRSWLQSQQTRPETWTNTETQ